MFRLIHISILLIVFASIAVVADETEKMEEKYQRVLSNLINKQEAVTELAGIQVVLIKNGQIVLQHANGMAHLSEDGDTVPLTINHKVRVASISKFVMALGFMQLVEHGKVALDRDVSDYLGFTLRNPNFPEHVITSRQLLSHTSSIRDAGVYFLPYGESFTDFFKPGKHYDDGAHFASDANQAPGEYFTYSNLNFGILAGIIEKVTNTRFDLYMDTNLFAPLGLAVSFNNCRFSNADHKYIATLYRRGRGGYEWNPDGPWIPQVDDSIRRCYYGGPTVASDTTNEVTELAEYVPGSNPTLFSPQGGLRASALDLAQLILLLSSKDDLQANGKEAILSRKTINAMLTPVWTYSSDKENGHTGGEADPDDITTQGLQRTYGLSTHIVNLKDWGMTENDHVLYGHMAAAYGLLGQLWFDPLTRDGIVILLTGMGDDPTLPEKTSPMEEVETQVLRIALDALREL